MITLKESLLDDIETTMHNGDDFVKGLDKEITNIQKNITKAKNWIKEGKFNLQIDTRLYTEFDAKNILEFLGISSKSNKVMIVVEYLGQWPFGGVGNSGMGRYHGRDSLYSFSHRRAVVTTPTWIDVPFRYMPYRLFRWIKALL